MKAAILTRRGFLRMTCAIVAMLPTRLPDLFAGTAGSPGRDRLAAKLDGFFHDKDSARAVGREYLRIAPVEADTLKLTELICAGRPERYAELSYASTVKLRRMLLHQQREDFDKGRIVNVKGWILSQTEARLCALATFV
jgi:hypothetical protein